MFLMSMQVPRFYAEGYGTIDAQSGKWVLKSNAPQWAKDELKIIKQLEKEAKKQRIKM